MAMAMRSSFKSAVKVTRRPVVSRNSLKVMCNASKSVSETKKEFDYIQFAETVNGRCAMQGFIWGSVKEAMTHESIMQQVFTKAADGSMDINPAGILEFSTIIGLVTLGTVFTSVVKDASEYSSETFTSDAEMVNSRLAMVGFFLLCFIHFQ
jgi:hypothetical protein